MNSTVATSAMPMGMPGWPDLAASTPSIASPRMAFAMRESISPLPSISGWVMHVSLDEGRKRGESGRAGS